MVGDTWKSFVIPGRPTIRIGVMTYNYANFLPSLFDSILEQNLDIANYHIVVYDDASTDNTGEVIARYQQTMMKPGLSLFYSPSEQNNGIWKHLKLMISNLSWYQASGPCHFPADFVQLVDGDDYFKPGKFEKQLKFFEDHPDYIACHTDIDELRDNGRFNLNFWKGIRSIPQGDIRNDLMRGNFIHTCSHMFRPQALKYFEVQKFMDLGLYFADFAFFLQMSKENKIGYIDEALSVYRNRDSSMSHSAENRQHMVESTNKMIELAGKGVL